MALQRLGTPSKAFSEIKGEEGQTVTVRRKTTIQGFTPEEELNYLVESGEWELATQSAAFQRRSPEGQVQVLTRAIDQRIAHLGKTLNYLVNRGPRQRQAAMNLLHRMNCLRTRRDEILVGFYEKGPTAIPDKASSDKISFY